MIPNNGWNTWLFGIMVPRNCQGEMRLVQSKIWMMTQRVYLCCNVMCAKCQCLLGLFGICNVQGLWIVPSMIGFYDKRYIRGTNNDWDLIFLGDNGIDFSTSWSGYADFQVVYNLFTTSCWSSWWGDLDLAKSKGLCSVWVRQAHWNMVTLRYFERKVTSMFAFESLFSLF